MSSTNRGAVRQADDFYKTPAWAVDAILPHLLTDYGSVRPDMLTDGTILEPGCGDGAIVQRLINAAVARRRICGVEIDETRAATCAREMEMCVHRGNFLSPASWLHQLPERRYKLSIGNPPFGLAMEFIETSLTLATTTCFLLRLNFLGSQKRAAWHRAHPSDLYVLPKRPSFTEHLRPADGEERCPQVLLQTGKSVRCDRANDHDGECMKIGTDSCEYMWAVWGPGRGGRWSILEAP